jgi:VCBS repeat-containing protein
MLSMKNEILAAGLLIVASFALGRFSISAVSATKLVESDNKTEQKELDKDTHTKTETVTIKKPDGTTKTVTTIDTTAEVKIDDKKTEVDNKVQTSTPVKRPTINVSALAVLDLRTGLPAYGASASKEILGPVTVGAFGLTNGVLGISIGLDF